MGVDDELLASGEGVVSHHTYINHRGRYRNMDDLTGFQRDVLIVVAGLSTPHGLAVKAELESYYPSEVHHGRFYPNLNTLVNKGLVEKQEREDDSRAYDYTLTARGQDVLEARREWERSLNPAGMGVDAAAEG